MGHRGFIVDAARLRPCGWDRPPGLAFTEHVDFTQWSQQDRAELAGRAGETVLAPARIDAYFAHLAVLVNGSSVFNVLAHCDYPRRYWPSARAGAYAEADFEQEYRAVSRALASRGGGCGESAGLAARA